MIGFIRASAATYGFVRSRQPAVHEVIAEPDVRVTPPDPMARAMVPSWYGPPSDEPPIELREARWLNRLLRLELEELADLTAVKGRSPWEAAQLMNWRR